MLSKRILQLFAFVLLLPVLTLAQVTTSSITGTIKSAKGPLAGASVVITHNPTGTVFKTVTTGAGIFNVENIPAGGPYTVTADYTGFAQAKQENIQIGLGEKFNVTLVLQEGQGDLGNVVVRTSAAKNDKMGSATNIARTQIVNLPNISRSLLDASKLNPQANGTSFLGMSGRYNNITVDGSVFNNNFGLGSNPLPGGASQPISIDAIDQLQVNITPYDVRQAGFTGAGVNAVTRRGTNEWYGTAYDYYRNQSFNGKTVDGTKLPPALKSSANIVGGSIGGPIIKNKLFFFINGEYEKRNNPGQNYVASTGANDNNPNAVKNVTAAQMDQMRDFLIKNYKYDPGAYQGYNFATKNTKFLARIDWNINDKNRLTLRYNQSETSDDNLTNTNSGPSPRISNGRTGGSPNTDGLNFSGSNYKQNNNVYSIVGEWNSKFSNAVSNQLLASYTKIHDFRSTPGSQFPFVDIMRDANNVLMSFGSELYSYQNYVKNNTWNISNNVSWNFGKHSFLFGASFDYMTFANSFANYGGQSYYRFASMQDFMENKAPTVFAVTYSNTDRTGITPATAKFGQLGMYLQDVYTVNDRLKLTYGVRFDLPFYPGAKVKNDSLYAIALKDPSGNDFRADVSTWPKARLLVSPRVGFTYSLSEDKTWVLRGGTGIFTGRIPFVWLVNQSSDNGVLNTQVTYSGAAASRYTFSPDRTAHVPQTLPSTIGIIPGAYYSVTSPDFKIPQVWRSNLAVDKSFGDGYTASVEAIYSKTLNAVYHYNANLGTAKGPLTGHPGDTRTTYNSSLTGSDKLGQVFVMDNNSKGYALALTAQLQRRFSRNWQASVAYTYNVTKDVSPNNGDRSQSSWTQNPIINNPNSPELGYSAYSIPHRVTAYVSYRLEYANKNMASTIALFYAGNSQGRYLYRYGGDLNGDGATNDLLYVPASRNGLEQEFTTLTVRNASGQSTTYTPQEQADAFWNFVQQDKYLSKRKGEYVDRYGAVLPWINQLDLRFLQDFSPKIGNKRHTLQFSIDVKNFLNMLNSGWGNQYIYNYGSFSDQGVLGVSGGKYTFNPNGAKPVYGKAYTLASTWQMQLGLRYIF
jgi:hypothetical protein